LSDVERMLDKYVRLAGARASRIRRYAEDPTVELGEEDFEYFIRSHRLVVVVFEAEWCSPCKVYKPIFLEAARKYAGRGVAFARLDTDKASRIADLYNVEFIPTTLFFVDSKPVDVLVGAMELATLERTILKYLPRT
jgi:thioredoxin-like negative regulator of GroEL